MSLASVTRLIENRGNLVWVVRRPTGTVCPCRTPEGFRDPVWHFEHPGAPECTENAILLDGNTVENKFSCRAFLQPVQSTRATRLSGEQIQLLFGEVQADDHLGIFPAKWGSHVLDFDEWKQDGSESIYDTVEGHHYMVVNANAIFDPTTRDVIHHHEVGLRRIREPMSNPVGSKRYYIRLETSLGITPGMSNV